MSAYTPGPWSTRRASHGGDVAIAAPDCHGPLAEVFEEFESAAILRPDVAYANARLIAAAPELLEAAEALLAWCNERFDNAGNDWSESAPAVECDALEAAIAKARGG